MGMCTHVCAWVRAFVLSHANLVTACRDWFDYARASALTPLPPTGAYACCPVRAVTHRATGERFVCKTLRLPGGHMDSHWPKDCTRYVLLSAQLLQLHSTCIALECITGHKFARSTCQRLAAQLRVGSTVATWQRSSVCVIWQRSSCGIVAASMWAAVLVLSCHTTCREKGTLGPPEGWIKG